MTTTKTKTKQVKSIPTDAGHPPLTAKEAWNQYWTLGKNFPEMSKFFGVSVGTLYARFKNWGFPTRARGPRQGTAGTQGILTDDQIRFVRQSDLSLADMKEVLAAQGKVISRSRLSKIRMGDHRKI